MSRFDADLRLLPLTAKDWDLLDGMAGAGLAAHNLTKATQAALDKMVGWVSRGNGVLTAAKRAVRHVENSLGKYEEIDAAARARGVLITIIEEYARRRFEADLDLYWALDDEEE